MNRQAVKVLFCVLAATILSCGGKSGQDFKVRLDELNLNRGDIALCGSQEGRFGIVQFDITCAEKVRASFNLATALLHSFEYNEAEKVFAKVIDEDPGCVMAYWGVAMSNYHSLWTMQENLDLAKGSNVVALGRSLANKSEREADYLEAIGAFYDDWQNSDTKTRNKRFELAMEKIYLKYPNDKEAAVFYALALNATADPADKSYINQHRAGEILRQIYPSEPNHPGIAHYLIHNYDYPELAMTALPAARAYAGIAPASAHAQHMPSHIFTRLGLWDESIQSNLRSISAAQCYASNIKLSGHWDEELHGMDYLTYALLQKGEDEKAKEQVALIKSYTSSANYNGKSAYVYAAIPVRYALERRQWKELSALEMNPGGFPLEQFPWESAMVRFARLLGLVHTGNIPAAQDELSRLEQYKLILDQKKEKYKANQVAIQIQASHAWLDWKAGKNDQAIREMIQAADNEDATGKHPVTPGEVVPARELLGDLYMELGMPSMALEAYERDLLLHANRYNGLYGAAAASMKSGNNSKAHEYFSKLIAIADANCRRPSYREADLDVGSK